MLQIGDIVQFLRADIYGVVVSKAVINKNAGNWQIYWFDDNTSECDERFLEKVSE